MEGRRLEVKINFEDKDITGDLKKDLLSFQHTDSINELDTLDISLINEDGKFFNEWKPKKGLKIKASVEFINWEKKGIKEIPIGNFFVDKIDYSGAPDICNIGAISVDVASKMMDQNESKVWQNITLEKIAKDIAKECNLKLYFEVDFNRQFSRIEQKLESNYNFLKRLCKESGVIVKLYNEKLILFEETIYEKKDSKFFLSKKDISSYSFSEEDTNTYNGCEITYYDPELEKTYRKKFILKKRKGYKKNTKRLLIINEDKKPPGETAIQREEYLLKIAEKALREKNKSELTGNIVVPGKDNIISVGDTFYLSGFGDFDKKYIVTKTSIDYCDYNFNIDFRQVQE